MLPNDPLKSKLRKGGGGGHCGWEWVGETRKLPVSDKIQIPVSITSLGMGKSCVFFFSLEIRRNNIQMVRVQNLWILSEKC